jgi:hypothetical protein
MGEFVMTERYALLPLNRLSQLRLFNWTMPQLWAILFALTCAYMLSVSVGRHAKVCNLPLGALLFICIFSISLVPIKMFDVRSLTWWRRLLQLKTQSTIPFSLPDLHLSDQCSVSDGANEFSINGNNHLCLRVEGADFKCLDQSRRQQVFDLLIDAVSGDEGLQMFSSSVGGSLTAERAFYVVADGSETTKNSLYEKLLRAGLAVQKVSNAEFRRIVFSHLSPVHAQSNSALPELIGNISDLLTLSVSGFTQNTDHIFIDGQYSRTVYFDELPTASYFGILNRFLEADSALALSVHFHACDQHVVRASLRRNFHLGLIGRVPYADPHTVFAELAEFMRGETSAIDVSLYITAYADSLEELDSKLSVLQGIAHRVNATAKTAVLQQLDGLISVLPLGLDKVQTRHTITTKAAATLFPFA